MSPRAILSPARARVLSAMSQKCKSPVFLALDGKSGPDAKERVIAEFAADYERLGSVVLVAEHQGYAPAALFKWLRRFPELRAAFDVHRGNRRGRARGNVCAGDVVSAHGGDR